MGRRKPANRPETSFVSIFCEGTSTEQDYLKSLEKHFATKYGEHAKVKFEGAGEPKTLVQNARDFLHESKRQGNKSARSADQVWVVFDRDQHKFYDKAKQRCEATKGLHLAYSNPCFELWLILHFKNYDKSDGHIKIQKYAQQCVEGLKGKRIPDPTAIMKNIRHAEKHAKNQREKRQREGNPDGCPSTSMYELTQAIREAMKGSK